MKPRVLIYSDCPIFGGAENLIVNILQHSELPEEFRIHFVYRDNPPYREGVERKITRRVPITPVRLPDRLEWIEAVENRIALKPVHWFFKALFRGVEPALFLYGIWALRRIFKQVRPDIVHINNGGYPGSLGCRAAAVAAKLAGARKVVFVVNSAAKSVKFPQAAFEPLIDRLVVAFSDIFVTASQFAGKALARRGFPADRIVQIPNSTPIPATTRPAADVRAELGLRPDETAFAMLAFFGPWKGHKVLVDAVARLQAEHPRKIAGMRILFLGDGPDLKHVQKLVAEAGLEEHIRFAGFRADAMDILNASDGLILPSIQWKGVSEDMPYCVLEAMALAKPVIASRLSGIAETVVHEETGLLFPPNDVEKLADSILRAVSDPGLRARMGEEGRRRFYEHFETGQTAKRYRDLYLAVMQGFAPPPPKPRVLIYADCPVFGGADVLTVHILHDERYRREFGLSYVYRYNKRFHSGLKPKLHTDVPVTRVRLLERQELLDTMERNVRAVPLRYLFKMLFRMVDYALFPFEVLVLWRVFRRARPDMVHVNNGGYPGALGCRAAAVAAKLAGADKVLFGVNNLARPLRLPWEAADAAIDRLVLSSTDIFVTASKVARLQLSKRGIPKGRIEAYPNGVAAPRSVRPQAEVRAELGLSDAEVAFAMVAYFEPRKGHMVLMEAAEIIAQTKPKLARDLKFVLVADGPEFARVKRAVRSKGLHKSFLFLGYRSDALDIINACDALILPSVAAEDMPVSILEAMALDKAVIGSDLAGVAEEIDDGRTGLLVPPGDAGKLADALMKVASDAGLRRSMGAAGRERFDSLFEIHKSAERYLGLYRRLLSLDGTGAGRRSGANPAARASAGR